MDRVGIRGLGVIVKLWDTGKQIIEVGMNFSYSFVRALYILKILCVHVCVYCKCLSWFFVFKSCS